MASEEEKKDYLPAFLEMQKAADAAFKKFASNLPEQSTRFVGKEAEAKATNYLLSPEYRAAMGNKSYGIRINSGADFSPGLQSQQWDKANETWAQFLARTKEAQHSYWKDAKIVPSNASNTQKQMLQNRMGAARSSDRFFVNAMHPEAANDLRFYFAARTRDQMSPTLITTYQHPYVDTAKTFGLREGMAFGGAKVTHDEGLSGLRNKNFSNLWGRQFGEALSSKPVGELLIPVGSRYDPRYLKPAGEVASIVKPETTIDINRPAVAQTREGKWIPEMKGFSDKALNILKGVGPTLKTVGGVALALDTYVRGNAAIAEQDKRIKGTEFDPNSAQYSKGSDLTRQLMTRGGEAAKAALNFATFGMYDETTQQNSGKKEDPKLEEVLSGKYYGQTL